MQEDAIIREPCRPAGEDTQRPSEGRPCVGWFEMDTGVDSAAATVLPEVITTVLPSNGQV